MPKKQVKSKYTADRGIPGAFEGETVTRRKFMVGTAHATGAIATSAILLPALGFALGPLFEEHKMRWQPVGTPDEFPNDNYVPKVISLVDGIGEAGKTTVYELTDAEKAAWRKALLPVQKEMASRVGKDLVAELNKEAESGGANN